MATAIDIPALLKKLTTDFESAQTEQQRRYTAGMSELSDVINMYSGDVSGKVSKAAMTAAKSGMVGIGKVSPKLSKTFQSAIKRMSTTGKAKALTTRASFQNAFPNLFPGPNALVNLATGGFSGLTRQIQAEGAGGPLAKMPNNTYNFTSPERW